MGVPFEQAASHLDLAIGGLFDADPRVHAVGIGRNGEGFGYSVIRNASAPIALAGGGHLPRSLAGVPVIVSDSEDEPMPLIELPMNGPGSPGLGFVPEQRKHRHLVCGLQIQNWDDDDRRGLPARGQMTVGTLGCFVEDASKTTALLTNNHVIAGHNSQAFRGDTILQPGATLADKIATLADFVALQISPPGARPAQGTVVYNQVDAALAELDATLVTPPKFVQGFLPIRGRPMLSGVSKPKIGDRVFKVGRTTGLQWGRIQQVGTTVGPIAYRPGSVWFDQAFVVEGENGTLFSDRGDSGSVIAKETGEAVGLLFAGNGVQTFACSLDNVLHQLAVTLL